MLDCDRVACAVAERRAMNISSVVTMCVFTTTAPTGFKRALTASNCCLTFDHITFENCSVSTDVYDPASLSLNESFSVYLFSVHLLPLLIILLDNRPLLQVMT